MDISRYPAELEWVNGKLREQPGFFLQSFLDACSSADHENYEILRPAVCVLMKRYPVRPEWTKK